MAVQKLGDVAVGTVVKLKENGVAQDYLVVHQGLPSSMYDASCNGTWLLRKKAALESYGGSVYFDSSTVFTTALPGILSRYDSDIQSVIKTVKIPYSSSGTTVQSGSNGLTTQLFILGLYELGITSSYNSNVLADGAKLDYFSSGTGSSANTRRGCYENSVERYAAYWTRSSYGTIYVWSIGGNNPYGADSIGEPLFGEPSNTLWIRPAMVMPTNLIVEDDGNVLTAPHAPALTVSSQAMEGQPIPVSWTASDGADSYTLQRKVDSGEWETVYTGADLQYQDTAGSWSTVQYQVAASTEGLIGDYAQSAAIPVISASALVISGSDEDLGVITRDIPYTVISDTGNEITLVCTVNGQHVDSRTVQSGFSYNIPVLDLPTGKGTIEISASVQTSGGPVTTARKWQYEKTALQWPNAGGVGQLTQNGKNVFSLTLAEAVRTAGGVGLDKILEQLMPLIGNVPKFMKGSYVGTGTSNVSLSAPGELLAVMVRTGAGTNNVTFPTAVMIKPTSDDGETVMGTFSGATSAGSMFLIPITWNGSEVSWTQAGGASDLVNSNSALNKKGVIYDYLLLYK